jgi:hypothetical protein
MTEVMSEETDQSTLFELCACGELEEVEERLGFHGDNSEQLIREVNSRSNTLTSWNGHLTTAQECYAVAGLLCDENR